MASRTRHGDATYLTWFCWFTVLPSPHLPVYFSTASRPFNKRRPHVQDRASPYVATAARRAGRFLHHTTHHCAPRRAGGRGLAGHRAHLARLAYAPHRCHHTTTLPTSATTALAHLYTARRTRTHAHYATALHTPTPHYATRCAHARMTARCQRQTLAHPPALASCHSLTCSGQADGGL